MAEQDNISVLEKIARIADLMEPWKMPLDLIQHYADTIGYEVGLNMDDVVIPTVVDQNSEEYQLEKNKHLRFMVSQLPEWYRIKSTRPSIKVLLYSFGLIGDAVYYYTSNYLNDNDTFNEDENILDKFNLWGTGEHQFTSYKDFNENLIKFGASKDRFKKLMNNWRFTKWDGSTITEDTSEIPDDFYPTPHFRVWYNLLDDLTSAQYSENNKKNVALSIAINAIKPINTVFDGVVAYYTTTKDLNISTVVKFRKYISLTSSSDRFADEWNTVSFTWSCGVFNDSPINVDYGYQVSVGGIDFNTDLGTSWNWDFGDGNTSTLQNPNNTFFVAEGDTTTFTITVQIDGGVSYSHDITIARPFSTTPSPE